jgi:hypothetical protein
MTKPINEVKTELERCKAEIQSYGDVITHRYCEGNISADKATRLRIKANEWLRVVNANARRKPEVND